MSTAYIIKSCCLFARRKNTNNQFFTAKDLRTKHILCAGANIWVLSAKILLQSPMVNYISLKILWMPWIRPKGKLILRNTLDGLSCYFFCALCSCKSWNCGENVVLHRCQRLCDAINCFKLPECILQVH